ncbi:MAG: hypothetical protein ACOZF0_13880 [Thermodesulfobacteriota bacterium]
MTSNSAATEKKQPVSDPQAPRAVINEVIEAHGGADGWHCLEALEADISVWGLLFTMKRRPVLDHVTVRANTKMPRFAFLDFPGPGQTGELIGDEEVRILSGDGGILQRRERPRSFFRGLRRQLFWDDLDFLYFGGYATWNYLTTPFLFLREGFVFEFLPLLPKMPASWSRLRVTFPDDIPTHCRQQEFFFDHQRRLRRLDYTAEVIGGWAHAAHLCEDYRQFNGIEAPASRRVRPLLFGANPLPGPTLVAIEVHEIRLIAAA